MHPSREHLTGLVYGTLAEDEADGVAEHVDQCPACEETVRGLEAKSDTYIASLRTPAAPDPYSQESDCERLISRIEKIGQEPSFATQDAVAAGQEAVGQLGQIGQYPLLAKLAEGGMGAVYKALHPRLGKVVAVKILPYDRLQDADAVARFDREMKAVGKLDHVNIVRAMDAGEADGMHFLVMEYVEGMDLSQLVKQKGPLPVAEACELIRQAAIGLEEARQHGMVHRDIKPGNLMLSRRGEVKVLDLGLALLSEAHNIARRELTGPGRVMGTIDYMAPEQGVDSHEVDIRADIYSLGATLYKLLTGKVIYFGELYSTPAQKMMALATQPAPPIQDRRSDLPDELAAIVHRMIAKDPDARFATPVEVAAALAPFASHADLDCLLAEALDKESRPPSTDTVVSEASPPRPVAPPPVSECVAEPRPSSLRIGWKRLAVAAGLAAIALLAVLLSVRTPYGTVIVEAEDENVQVVVKQGGKEVDVIDADSNWLIKLREGKYEIELRGGDDRLRLVEHTVTVKRREKVRVKVELRRAEKAIGVKPTSLAIAPFDAAHAKTHQEERAEQLGVPIKETNSIGMEFRLIPPGEFLMGSPDTEGQLVPSKFGNGQQTMERMQDEGPHQVRITKPFYLGVYEVTQEDYERVTGTNPSHFSRAGKGKDKVPEMDTSRFPVEMVSWELAVEFCRLLSAMPAEKSAGRVYRLATEAEWEYACRAGTTTPFHFGNKLNGWAANCNGEEPYGTETEGSYLDRTTTVGSYQPNAFGLYDMHGNVFEWCQDWYAGAYYDFSPSEDPAGPATGSLRVTRGSSWAGYAHDCRSAARVGGPPGDRHEELGFRVVLVPVNAPGR
jgi:formylglycine-generating enzyme required for sulfatase activity/serine/threonine protein kinase